MTLTKEKVFVTKSFMPPLNEYMQYVEKVFNNAQLTNGGPLVKELEAKLIDYLGIDNIQYVTNGTIALQLALRALDIEEGEVITTPFTYVATTSSILWEKLKPVYVDIEPKNFTLDPDKIEEKITPKTRAIMPVHVFGYACDVDKIQKIADKYNLKVIYDAAHSFGARYKGKSLASYGDISTLSFHATKLFHTVEGGACIIKDEIVKKELDLLKRFGHNGDEHFCLGINGKQSEIHAAMGLSILPYMNEILEKRRRICKLYDELLKDVVQLPDKQKDHEHNYAYYPVVFKSEEELLRVFEALKQEEIYPRRYFYPSLNKLPYILEYTPCPISEDISKRIACLPLHPTLNMETVEKISKIIRLTTNEK